MRAAILAMGITLLAVPAADAGARFRVTGGVLAPGHAIVLAGSGLAPGLRVTVRLDIAGHRLVVGHPRATRRGRIRLVVRYTPAVAAAAQGVVGTIAGSLVVGRRVVGVPVLGVVLDPLSLSVVPDGPVGFDEPLRLRMAGAGATGPPLLVQFTDCGGIEHALPVARPAVPGDLDIVLPAHTGVRTSIDTSCFADLGLELAQIEFAVGEIVGGSFHGVASARAWFLPPSGT